MLKTIRGVARKGKRLLTNSSTAVLRRVGVLGGEWETALPVELAYWENALKDGGKGWNAQEYRDRTDPNLELQDELKALIPAPVGSHVRILDVGAGPLTRIGKRWDGRSLEIVAVDALAEEYNSMLKKISLQPLVPVRFGHAEKLLEKFEADSFDLAYASNCLDHGYDPVLAIRQMLAVVKPRHFVYLWHFENVGLSERYSGLHQWNFTVEGNDMMISDGKHSRSLRQEMQGSAMVEGARTRAFDADVVIVRLQKLAK